MNRQIRVFFSLLLVCSLMLPSLPYATATAPAPTDNYTVSFTSNSIIEQVTTALYGTPILITRTTYADNTAVVEVVENGDTSTFSYFVDYNILYQNLSHRQLSNTIEVLSRGTGYVYTPMKSQVFTDYLTPENLKWATVLGLASLAMAKYGIPYSDIVAIAGMILAGSGADVETKLVTTMDWYFKTLDGEFISYYCEYTTTTYVLNESGSWIYVGTESGIMESLTVW